MWIEFAEPLTVYQLDGEPYEVRTLEGVSPEFVREFLSGYYQRPVVVGPLVSVDGNDEFAATVRFAA